MAVRAERRAQTPRARRAHPAVVRALLLFGWLGFASAGHAQAAFDIVVAKGRAIDPETGLDGVRWIGIRDGRIAAISRTPLRADGARRERAWWSAPGFIDLHAHGQDISPAARMQAFDGVTTALELEAGSPVAAAYDLVAREGRPINYGFAVSWLFARIAEKEGMEPTGADLLFPGSPAADRMAVHPRHARGDGANHFPGGAGPKEGGLGIGMLAGYAPGLGGRRPLQWPSSRRATAFRPSRTCDT